MYSTYQNDVCVIKVESLGTTESHFTMTTITRSKRRTFSANIFSQKILSTAVTESGRLCNKYSTDVMCFSGLSVTVMRSGELTDIRSDPLLLHGLKNRGTEEVTVCSQTYLHLQNVMHLL